MIPLGDDNWDRQRWPVVTAGLVVVNVLVFLYELALTNSGGERALSSFIVSWGIIPREYAAGMDLAPTISLPYFSTLVTSMFLHGGWGHLLGNMLYLWVFGDNVEDRIGRIGYVAFYLTTGIVGAIAQILANPNSMVPTVGASGAISGVLGAYLVMFPHKRVRVLLFYFVTEVRAVFVIGMWAVTQFLSGAGSLAVGTSDGGGVAYLAHVGGFIAGVVFALIVRARSAPEARKRPPAFSPYDFR